MRPSPGAVETLRFRYRPQPGRTLLVGAFFALCAIVLVHMARTNDRGMVINHIIELDPAWARGVLWALAACAVAFVLVALVSIASALGQERWIVLDKHAVTAPPFGFSKKQRRIAFADVADLRLRQVHRQRFVEIVGSDGRKLSVPASMLSSQAEFDRLLDELARRCDVGR